MEGWINPLKWKSWRLCWLELVTNVRNANLHILGTLTNHMVPMVPMVPMVLTSQKLWGQFWGSHNFPHTWDDSKSCEMFEIVQLGILEPLWLNHSWCPFCPNVTFHFPQMIPSMITPMVLLWRICSIWSTMIKRKKCTQIGNTVAQTTVPMFAGFSLCAELYNVL